MRTALSLLLPTLLAAPLLGAAAAELEATLEGSRPMPASFWSPCVAPDLPAPGLPLHRPGFGRQWRSQGGGARHKPGVYPVQAFHDEIGNLDLDRSIVGMPEEDIGFSNDALMRFGPPTAIGVTGEKGRRTANPLSRRAAPPQYDRC